jgi:hypothetical protein
MKKSVRVPPHYEAAWSDSSCHCRCFHTHPTLIQAAQCGASHPGFYVIAIESGETRELTTDEDKIVDAFRFGNRADSANA